MLSLAEQPPAPVRATALTLGAPGEARLTGLDRQVAELCDRWELAFVKLMTGGIEACVAGVVTTDGRTAVLKVAPPAGRFAGELATLKLGDGRDYAEVYASDAAARAVLLERLGPHWPSVGCRSTRSLRRSARPCRRLGGSRHQVPT